MENSSDFLEAEGDSHTFGSSAESLDFFTSKDFRQLPRETEGVKEDSGDMYTLSFYLQMLSHGGILEFPLTVQKSEKPDFVLIGGQVSHGLEVRQGSTTEIEREKTKIGPDSQFSTIEFGRHSCLHFLLLRFFGHAQGDVVETYSIRLVGRGLRTIAAGVGYTGPQTKV